MTKTTVALLGALVLLNVYSVNKLGQERLRYNELMNEYNAVEFKARILEAMYKYSTKFACKPENK